MKLIDRIDVTISDDFYGLIIMVSGLILSEEKATRLLAASSLLMAMNQMDVGPDLSSMLTQIINLAVIVEDRDEREKSSKKIILEFVKKKFEDTENLNIDALLKDCLHITNFEKDAESKAESTNSDQPFQQIFGDIMHS